jgi:hypothetical protein
MLYGKSYKCDDCIKHLRPTRNDDTPIKIAPKKVLSPERGLILPPVSDGMWIGCIWLRIGTGGELL